MQAPLADLLGFSCRFPESRSPAEFWDGMASGRDMVTEDGQHTLAEVNILAPALQDLRLGCSEMGVSAELPRDPQQEKDSAVQYNVDVQVTNVRATSHDGSDQMVSSRYALWLHLVNGELGSAG